jgi:hypothetical protein
MELAGCPGMGEGFCHEDKSAKHAIFVRGSWQLAHGN